MFELFMRSRFLVLEVSFIMEVIKLAKAVFIVETFLQPYTRWQ